MPKLPKAVTKAIAPPAISDGIDSGKTVCAQTRTGPAPDIRAASTSSAGIMRSPARRVRNTSEAC